MTTGMGQEHGLTGTTREVPLVRRTWLQMGMPITVAMALRADTPRERARAERALGRVYAYLDWVDATFSTYKVQSEISRLNRGEIAPDEISAAMREVLALAEETRRETHGYFDITRADGSRDPSGVVKGWAIAGAADLLARDGWRDCYVDAGGDAQVAGTRGGQPWRVGIRNPFNRQEHVKVLELRDCGIATSGSDVRGQHIYNPHQPGEVLLEVASITVVAPSVYDADRMATAAFAMGRRGIDFIASLPGYAGYSIDLTGNATYTSGLERYIARL